MLAHRLFGGGSSSLSVSRPSLGSALIAAARARLWSSFRRRSESPLLVHQETKRQEIVSCLFGSCRLFPGLPPSQLWCANPFRLCSRRQPQSFPCDPTEARSPSLSSQPRLPRRVSTQGSRAGECCSAPSLCAGISPFFPLRPCCCGIHTDSRGSRPSRVRLGGALNPLSSHTRKQRGKKKSLASSAAADFFPDSLPASCGALAPSGCVHAANRSPLPAIRPKPKPQLPAPPAPAGEQTSLSGWCVLVGTNPLCGNLSALPSAPLWLRSPPWLRSFPPLLPAVSAHEGAS